jgi:signal transduction histidine kinase/CheY-like chemotaxis protein
MQIVNQVLIDQKERFRNVVELVLIAIGYFALAKASLFFASVNPSATPIWPPTGLAVALVLVRGYRVLPAIFIGAFAANLATAGSMMTSLTIALGNSLEAGVATVALNKWAGGYRAFESPLGIAKFVLIMGLLSTPASATIGVVALTVSGYAAVKDFATIWVTWWLGNLAGAVLVAPAVILWTQRSSKRVFETSEAMAIFVLSALVGLLAFSPLPIPQTARHVFAFLAVLPILWAALRLGQRETATVAVILSGFAIWGVSAGRSPFLQATLNDSFLLLIAFILSATLPSLALGAAILSRSREAKAALEQTREELFQAQKLEAIGQLTGGIAHDFNNLLMVISGGLRLMNHPDHSEQRTEILDQMAQAIERGTGLTRKLLSFARRETLHPEPTDVAARIEAMRGLLERSLRENIKVEISCEPGLWPIMVDSGQLELVILNLAVNARDAMPDGGLLKLLAKNVSTENGDFVSISVSDTGVGMEPEVQVRAFEPFFTTKDAGRGTGLGLSQAYGFVKQSGGTALIDSAPGRGTNVTLLLPRTQTMPVSGLAPVRSELPPASGVVLMVEDDDSVASVVCNMIHDLGYQTIRAGNASEALRILEHGNSIDILFSDIVMPDGVNGIELAKVIRSRRPSLPIVLTTGYPGTAALQDCPFSILKKPYQPEELSRALHEANAAG